MTQLGRAAEISGGRRARNPVRRSRGDACALERRVIRALDYDQDVAREVLGGDEPRRLSRALAPADAEPAALSERVSREATMLADDLALRRLDGAGPRRQPAAHEIAERPLADEADAGRIRLSRHRQAAIAGDAPHFGLAQASDRKDGIRQLAYAQRVQEVALVLGAVDAAQQPPAVGARVMAGREALSAEAPRVVERDAELDLAVAQHVGVRRAPGLQLGEEAREDAFAILGSEARLVKRHRKLLAHAPRVLEVGGRRAVAVVVFSPVGHEQGFDPVTRVLQQCGRDGGVDAAGKRDDHVRHRATPRPRAARGRRAGPGRSSQAGSARRAGSPRRTARPGDCGVPRRARRARCCRATGS
jgi:hypothetical protein